MTNLHPDHNHPARIIDGFTIHTSITRQQLKGLVQQTYDVPVISVYLNISPDRLLREREIYLTVFDSLKHTALQKRQPYLQFLSHQADQSVRQGLSAIYDFLQNHFDASRVKSVAIFYSGDQLRQIYLLNMPGRDYLTIDADPYSLPLETQLLEQEAAIVLHIDQNQAHFYIYKSGDLEPVEMWEANRPDSIDISLDKSRPNKVQRHEQDMLHQFFNQVSRQLRLLQARIQISHLILAGDQRVLSDFTIPKSIQLIAAVPYSPHQTEQDLRDHIHQTIVSQEVQEEGHYLDVLHRLGGQAGLIQGLAEVLEQQNKFQIRTLLVSEDLKQPGYYCPQDFFLATAAGQCPICDQPLTAIDNAVDKLVELARQYQVDYKVLHARKDALAPYGGIVATRYAMFPQQ